MSRRSSRASKVLRLALSLTTVAVIAIITAGPAAAQQRDPFDPLVSNSSVDDTGVPTTTTDSQADTSTPTTTQPVVQESSLPNTGSNVSKWLAVAYVLVASGAALLLLARMLQPRRDSR